MKNKQKLFISLAIVAILGIVLFFFLNFFNRQQITRFQAAKKEASLEVLKRDQGFPIKPVNESYGKAFVVENFVLKKIPLVGDYYAIASITGLYQDVQGKEQRLIIPISVYNQATNQMQTNGFTPREFTESRYNTTGNGWSKRTGINPGQIVFVTLMMPSPDLANNSTQGFGFETANDPETTRYTQADLDEFYQTGNPDVFPDHILWPVVHIYADSSLNDVNPNEPITTPQNTL